MTSLYASNQSKQLNYWNDIIKHPQSNAHSSMSTSNSANNMNSPSTSLPSSPTSEHASDLNYDRDGGSRQNENNMGMNRIKEKFLF